MSVPGHHALLFEVAGGVVLVGVALAFLLKKKKTTTVETMTAEDMQQINSRLVDGDVHRTESRFRRRYGVDARAKDFAKPREEPKPDIPKDEEPTS